MFNKLIYHIILCLSFCISILLDMDSIKQWFPKGDFDSWASFCRYAVTLEGSDKLFSTAIMRFKIESKTMPTEEDLTRLFLEAQEPKKVSWILRSDRRVITGFSFRQEKEKKASRPSPPYTLPIPIPPRNPVPQPYPLKTPPQSDLDRISA